MINNDLKIFEFGYIYGKIEKEFIEEKHLSISLVGNAFNKHWDIPSPPNPFFYFKGILKDLFERLGYDHLNFQKTLHWGLLDPKIGLSDPSPVMIKIEFKESSN